jgi:SAM-dependent methyltransferase
MNLHSDWLSSPVGQTLIAQESALVGAALQQLFGDHIVQIGRWGEANAFLTGARTRYRAVVDAEPGPGISGVVNPRRLSIATDSVDAVFLPHTLELSRSPHAVLREVQRILRPDGRLVVLGFNPISWWGLRHQFAERGYPTGVVRHISRRRMADWLNLLNLRVDEITPVAMTTASGRPDNLFNWMSWSRPAYMVLATKETIPMTPVRPRVRHRARLVSSLVNPSTRNVA